MRTGARAALSSLGLLLLAVGLFMAIGGLSSSAERPVGESGAAGGVVAVVGLVLLGGGWALEFLAFPTATALGGLVAAVVALLAADGLFVTSVVLGHAEPQTFDPQHAAAEARLGAVLCVIVAVALIAAWIVWRGRRGAGARVRHALSAVTVGCGAWVFYLGVQMVLIALAVIGTLDGVFSTGLQSMMAFAGLATLGCAGGAVLLWHGASALTRADSARYRPPAPWLLFAIAAVAVGVGALLLQSGQGLQLVPLLYPFGIILPGMALLALTSWAGRRAPSAQRTTWREILLMAGWGMIGAATIAVVLEATTQETLLVLRLASQGGFDGITNYNDYRDALQNAGFYLSDRELLIQLLLTIAVFGPLIEEFCKGFGVRLLRGARPTRHQAFLFGVAAGVGFGMVEAFEYSFGAFVASPYHWWDTLLIRAGSSSLHALASGTVGIAWFYAFRGRRLRALGLFLVAYAIHGSWNALNVLAAAHVLPGFKSLSDTQIERALEVICGVIALLMVAALCRISSVLAAHDSEPPAPDPSSPYPLYAPPVAAPPLPGPSLP